MTRKNILFIIPEMAMGGAQNSLSKISAGLSSCHNVWIVVFNREHQRAHIGEGQVLSLDVVSGAAWILKLVAFIRRVRRLRELKRRLNIEVSISFLEGADYVNLLSRRKEKVVLSIRGSKVFDENMHRQNYFLRRNMIKLLYRRADMIVCVNQGISMELTATYHLHNVPTRVIHNFCDPAEIAQLARQPQTDRMLAFCQHPVMTMSGRLSIEKGHSFVVGLFARLKISVPGLKLLMIGDGDQRMKLLDQCLSLNLRADYLNLSASPPDVFITGEVENVFNCLKYATLYILNSSSEGFPNGLIEAMACGIPVVSADCPYGPREILAPDTVTSKLARAEYGEYGVLLPQTNDRSAQTEQIWLDTLAAILSDEGLRAKYAELGMERVKHFSRNEILSQWIRVMEG